MYIASLILFEKEKCSYIRGVNVAKKRKKKSPPAVSTVIIHTQLTYFNVGLRKNKLSSSSNII